MKKEATSRRIRQDFFDFFAERDHKVVASAPIVPHDDPTLLFTNAGMNQFKDVFLGTGSRSYVRAADTQKCLRVSGKHNDLEEVGNDTYHHTFFEMLGNWSFGDYFKEEAIRWAWELLVDRWGLDPDRLYATVHAGDERLGLKPDDEAADLWKSETAIDPNHILLGSTKDNFWMMGETGPSGPCSEVHVDLRPDEDRARIPGASLVNKDHPEVIEIWNLVFIQYDAKKNGDLEPLTAKHVDTGMGLERVVAALDGSISTYDTDLFSPLLQKIADLTHVQGVKSYDDMDADAELRERLRIAMRVIADHVRAIAFAIADGVLPGNEGRGYVIRRILRRAVRYGYQVLDFRDPFMFELVAPLVEKMGDQFGDLVEKQTMIEDVIRAEEESFLRTLAAGITFFESLTPYVLGATAAGDSGEASIETNPKALDLLLKAYSAVDRDEAVRSFDATSKAGVLAGEIAFLLHDTYGFPVDLTRLMAREKELNVDMVRFDELMTGQRDRARAASQFKDIQVTPGSTQDDGEIAPTTFVGYNTLEYDGAEILSQTEVDGEGQKLHRLVLDTTPFYAESGGQLGDTGILTIGEESVRVLDTRKSAGVYYHIVDGVLSSSTGKVTAMVDAGRRSQIRKHHTATHLMHAALRERLGNHVEQRGSLVAPDRLRFDFSHFEKVDAESLTVVADQVNELIQRNVTGQIEEGVPIEEARDRGAMMLFGEKYGDIVRVVTFDPEISVELCGGTHVDASGEIGVFQFVSEGSIASGIRRVEAVVGRAALDLVRADREELHDVRSQFKSLEQPVGLEVAGVVAETKRLKKELESFKEQSLLGEIRTFVENATTIGDVTLAVGRFENVGMDTLLALGERLRELLGNGSVGLIGSSDEASGKAYLVATVSDDLIAESGVKAGTLVGQVAQLIGGGGGGRPTLASAGGRSPEKLESAMAEVPNILSQMLNP